MVTTATTAAEDSTLLANGIPVRNLWLLMFYASELRHLGAAAVGTERQPDELPDLVAEILRHFVRRRLRQNLSRGYIRREEHLTRVRGRIDSLETARHCLLERGKVACCFEELTIDTPRNRYVRGALSHVSALVRDRELRKECRMLAGQLTQLGVTGATPTRLQILTERFGRHDAGDRPMLAAAQLALELQVPTEQAGRHALLRPDRDERWLRQLFEKAVAGFYEVTLGRKGWRVLAGKRHRWPVQDPTSGMDDILPVMITDIILENVEQRRRIVIDTKFNSILTSRRHGGEALRSDYLYQIYAYLRTAECSDSLSETAEGLLLHPALGAAVDESATVQGHRIRFATVDLAASTGEIRRQLLGVVEAP